jgi:hypothetical protein
MLYSPGVNTATTVIATKETTGLVPFVFDYIGANYAGSTSDVYTYKTGGAGGTTVSTITVNWTDATKSVLVSVVRT